MQIRESRGRNEQNRALVCVGGGGGGAERGMEKKGK